MTTPTNLDAALGYASLGRSVIPAVPGGKLPAIEWKRYQRERATPDRIRHWWNHTAGFNVGIVTGQISGVVIVDVDLRKPGAADSMAMIAATYGLPITPEVTTATGGIHLWYAHPGGGIRIPNSAGQLHSGVKTPGVDIRGDGGFAVCPPSTRPEGAYTWCEWLCDLAPLPDPLLEQLIERELEPAREIAPWRARVQANARPPGRGYLARAVSDELDQLEQTGGHFQLTRSAFSLGQLAHLGIDKDKLVEQLADAALVNAGGDKSRTAAVRTAKECFTAGEAKPREPK